MNRLSLVESSADRLWQGLRAGEAKPLALWREAAERHARFGEKLNAYKLWLGEAAEAQAKAAEAAFGVGADPGPLQGLPISIKDVYGIAGTPTYAGTARRLPAHYETEGYMVSTCAASSRCFPARPIPCPSPSAASAATPIGARRGIRGTPCITAAPAAPAPAPAAACGRAPRWSASAAMPAARSACRPR
jgi:hypothetical protein